ncbi:hypothetical protein ACLI4Y_04820 [Natrialbaceae archaeon A-CW3]
MATLAALTFGFFALGAGALAYVLTSNLEHQPEYPTLMTDGMRLIGVLIALAGGGLGVILLGYAILEYVG